MSEQAYAYVTLIPVAKGFQQGIAKELAGIENIGEQAGSKTGTKFVDGFSNILKTGAIAAAGFAVGAVAAFKPAIEAADDFFAGFEGVNQVFGPAAKQVQAFAADAANSLGMSETAALNAAKQLGVFASAAGLTGTAAADFSTKLLSAAADLGSFNNVPIEQTLAAIQSGLIGQSEPLRQFGIFLDEASVKAWALNNGLGDTYDSMSSNEKTLVRQQALLAQLGAAQGDFVNYSDTYGNSIKTIQATFEDLQTQVGLALMPTIQEFAVIFRDALADLKDPTTELGAAFKDTVDGLLDFIQYMKDNWDTIKRVTIALGGAYAAITIYRTGVAVATGLQVAFNAAVAANPIGLLIVALGLAAVAVAAFHKELTPAEKTIRDNTNAEMALRQEQIQLNQLIKQGGIEANYYKQKLAEVESQLRQVTAATTESAGELNRYNNLMGNNIPQPDYTDSMGYLFSIGQGPGQTKPTASLPTGGAGTDYNAQMRQFIKDMNEAVKDARERYKDARDEARKDYNRSLATIQEDYKAAVAEANKRYADQVADITKRYNDAVRKATEKRDKSLANAIKNYDQSVAEINADFAKRQADIVQRSMDSLRNVFASAVRTNVAAIFDSNEIAGSIDGTIEMMREKLLASRKLISNAAALSAAGFSQTFIEQIVGAGTEVGNEMATAILNSSPEQQAEMLQLFSDIESTAAHGMDSLAQSLYEKNGLATEELRNLYAQTELELQQSLANQKQMYDDEVARIEEEFTQSIADAQSVMNEAMQAAQEELDAALADAKTARDEALYDAEQTLLEALLQANKNFNDELNSIEKQFNDKISSMKGKISGLSSQLAALQNQINNAQGWTSANITSITPRLTPFADGGFVNGPTPALVGEAGPEVIIPLDRFESMMGLTQGGSGINYYAAPNQSLDSEQALFDAMKRVRVVVDW